MRVAFWAAMASAVAILFSIAASQILQGVAIVAIAIARPPIRVPRVWVALAGFLLLSMVSLLFSSHIAQGMPQVRKLYVYLMLPVISTVIGGVINARNLALAWIGATGVTTAIGVAQFTAKWREAAELHRDFYTYYLADRITGAMSHWMTFSGQEMLVFLILISFLLFARIRDRRLLIGGILAAVAMGIALLLTDTRSVWIAVFVALIYLTWSRHRALTALIPVVTLLAFTLGPYSMRERAFSIFHPRGDVDSNSFRVIVWRTGIEMIRAHPLLGLGPEQVHQQFYAWLPPDIERPLPPGYYGHLHNIYVHYAAERGIPAMLLLVLMLLWIIYDCTRALKRLPPKRDDSRFLLHATVACVIGIMVEGFAELNLGDSEVLTLFLIVVSCGYAAVTEVIHVPRQS